MSIKTIHRKRFFLAAAILLTALFALQGCVVFLATVATVVNMGSSNHFTTTVLVKKQPADVYEAMLSVVERKNDVEIVSRDADAYMLEATRGEQHLTAKATAFDSGMTQLMVTADAGESDRTSEDLALDSVKQICEELGVKYKLAEE
jgi:hypothetical protein